MTVKVWRVIPFLKRPGFLVILGYFLVAFPTNNFTGGDGIRTVTKTIVKLPATRKWFVLLIPNQRFVTSDIRVVVV